jgi:hypothetical protein
MSAKSKSSVASKSVASNASKHYCKVCHDSGKPESEYRSHSTRETRDPNSRITCPLLLAIECRFCHKSGHTVKYCPALKEKKRDEARASKRVLSNPKPVVVEKVTNFYDCLLEEDSDVLEVEEDFPNSFNTVASTSDSQLNYAAALAKPMPMQVPVRVVRTASVMPMEKKSWVQMSMESDSDEEDGSAW